MNKIFNENCLETMQRLELTGKVDLVITSPPYNTSRVGASDKYNSRYDTFQDFKSDQDYIDWTIDIFNGYDTVLRKDGCVLYNISYSSENTHLIWLVVADIIRRTNFTTADCIIWKKSNALPNNRSKNKLTRIIEYVFVFVRKSELKTFDANKKVVSVIEKTGQANYETPCTKIYAGVEKTIPEWCKVFPDMWGEDFAIKKDWFEKVEDNCVFDSKRINDRMQELKEQEEAFNAARKGLKNTVADERTFHGEYYKDFNDYQVKKFTKELNSFQLKYFHKLAGTYYKKEIWQGIANNVSDLLKRGTSNEEIGEYLKTQFEILGK